MAAGVYICLHGVFICQLSPQIVPLGGLFFSPDLRWEKAQGGYQTWTMSWTGRPAPRFVLFILVHFLVRLPLLMHFLQLKSLFCGCRIPDLALPFTSEHRSFWITLHPLDQNPNMKQPIWDIWYHLNVRMLLLWAQAIAKLPDQRQTVAMCSAGKSMIFHIKQNKRKSLHIQINTFSEFIFQTR